MSEASQERPRAIVACRALEPEIEQLDPAAHGVETHYLDQDLHRLPHLLPEEIQAVVDRIAPRVSTIALGYGLCSNAVVGVVAPAQGLVIPKVHDCIALLLGSREAYQEAFRRRAGSYYLTRGWLDEQKDPIGVMTNDYVPRVGREDAEWALREEMKHYTHIVLIRTAATDIERCRARGEQNADFLGMTYEEVEGRSEYLRRLVAGQYDGDDFLQVGPHERVEQRPFLS